MSPWSKSSSKEAKKNTNGGGLFGLIKRKLNWASESKQISSRRRGEIPSKMGSNSRVSSPPALVARSQNFAERPHTYPLPLPENLPQMSRVDLGKRASRNSGGSKGTSPLLSPLPKSYHAQNGHDTTNVKGNLAMDSVFTDTDSDSDGSSDFRLLSPQASSYVTGNNSSTNNHSSGITFITQKKREKLKPVQACACNQMLPTSQKQQPLSRNMANLQIPQSGGFMASPSRSPMRVLGPEPALTSGFWAMRPYADTGFLGSGPCSSPGSPLNSSHNLVGVEMAAQPFWQHNRCSHEYSPIPSPRMTSPGPSSRIQSGSVTPLEMAAQPFWQHNRFSHEYSPIPSPSMTSPGPSSRIQSGSVTPLHPSAGGSNMDSRKQQTHRLPLPPLAMSNTGFYSPLYSTRTTPMFPKSPGRADLSASQGSRWKKGQRLGRGTFGEVYLGFDSESGQMCAMKEVTLFSDDARSKECARQLAQEVALLSRLRHPNVVQYYGSESVDDKLYIYLEYVAGGSIYKLLQDHGKFGEYAIRSYTRQILSGLAYLHSRNTVHRDIKGANILVDPNGCVKLADFGMAKHISGPSSKLSFKGSPHWMAPEIINNTASGFNLVVDIWSLGCTVVEMATTKPPWSQYEGVAALYMIANSKGAGSVPDNLSDDGKDFIMQCMQWDPSNRPSAAQLLEHPFVKNIASSERLIPDPVNIKRALPMVGQREWR